MTTQIFFLKHVYGPRVLGFETEKDRDDMVHSLRLSGHTVEAIDLAAAWDIMEPDGQGYRRVTMMSSQGYYRLPPDYLASN